jgi:serine/threonine-protein kinase HipA
VTAEMASVYKGDTLAAYLTRKDGGTEFSYTAEYLRSGGAPVASTLPKIEVPVFTPAGAVPPFFAGLLPEGRRLSALRRALKTSADDELSLLIAVGRDTIGDVRVSDGKRSAGEDRPSLVVATSFDQISFTELLSGAGIATTPTFAGVQDKASAAIISVPIARRNARYILKLNPPENPHLVEDEAFFYEIARRSRMRAAPSAIVRDRDNLAGLLVTRFDRVWRDDRMEELGVEDACQAMALWPADKYNVTTEQAAAALLNLTAAPTVAARDILRQVVFAWLTGNGDLHAKNMSVLDSPATGPRIAPAYDLPSTLFYDDTVMALTIGGKDTLSSARLSTFAGELGLPAVAAMRTIAEMVSATSDLSDRLEAAGLPFDRKITEKVKRQLVTRHRDLARGVGG